MLRQRTWILLALLLLGGGLAFAGRHAVAAAPTSFSIESIGGQVGLGNADLKQVVLNIIRWALGFVTLAALVYMIYGGYLWLTAAGNEQRVEKAKQVILQAAIGLVIILLAWAIVFFVVRTVANTTTNTVGGPGGGCSGLDCPIPGDQNFFAITAANTCAVPDPASDVPRSSAVSFTFNADVQSVDTGKIDADGTRITVTLAEDPVYLAVNSGGLQIEECADATCAPTVRIGTPPQNPPPINGQVYTPGGQPAGAAGATKAEWVSATNTLTFYHLSFSDTETSPDNRWFKPTTTYRVTMPYNAPSTALRDVRDRVLAQCHAPGTPAALPNCVEDQANNKITWTFTTGTDTAGQPLIVDGTAPSSAYLTNAALSPDRNVPRSATLGINFNQGIDPASATMANFKIYKFTTPPSQGGNWMNGATDTEPLPAADFNIRVNRTGTGVWVQYASGKLFEPFTWYKIVVQNMRNLCGTAMVGTREWVFETNDVTPGVDQVYPTNGFQYACPNTKVFIQFRTSMWDITQGSACLVNGDSSYHTSGQMNPDPGRAFDVIDQVPNVPQPDPNAYCKTFAFTPESAGLTPGQTYSLGVSTNRTIDVNSTKLSYGDNPPLPSPATQGNGWSFAVKPADQCFQAPVITDISPGEDANGACVSVLGDYFTDAKNPPPATVYPRTNDSLSLGDRNQSVPTGAWQTQSIVSQVDAGTGAGALAPDQTYPYQVAVNYGAPINGQLRSNTKNFRLDGGQAANRPCLYSVNPNSGPAGQTQFDASGKNFGANTGAAQFATDNVSPWSVTGSWTDTSLTAIKVPAGAEVRQSKVWVVNAAGVPSNQLSFNVQSPQVQPSDVPRVVEDNTCNIQTNTVPSPNPYRGDDNACSNTVVSAKFTMDMDQATINNATIHLNTCTSPTSCGGPDIGAVLPDGLRGIKITPGTLTRNTLYQVTVTTGVKAAASLGGKPLAQNYVWQFTTADTDETCPVAGVVINQSDQNFNRLPFSVLLPSHLVDAACHLLDPGTATYTWQNTNTACVKLAIGGNTDTQQAEEANDPMNSCTADVSVNVATKTSTPVHISYNPIACVTNNDCARNELGESCGSSSCVQGSCTPVVTGLDPDNGPIGTWTTVKGCWFGGYVADQSKVIFSQDIEGLAPSGGACGTPNLTWTNSRIVREAPDKRTSTNTTDDAVTGPIRVVRSDGQSATSSGDFTVNSNPLPPGLCRLSPTSGPVGDQLTASGFGFGDNEPGQRPDHDQETFTPVGTTTPAVATNYLSWADGEIQTQVPTVATGASDVRVKNNDVNSNPWPFTVNLGSGQCATACIFPTDNSCAAGQACGYDGCCYDRPTVTSLVPPSGSTNICRNTVAQISFDQPLDSRTVNSSTVLYRNGAAYVAGNVGLTGRNGDTITYNPGLLSPSAPQQLSLSAPTGSPAAVKNKSFEQADANGVPSDWTATVMGLKQSTDRPSDPAAGQFSALADCASGGCIQAGGSQNIGIPTIAPLQYRITGWVKAEIRSGSEGGLITQCNGSAADRQACQAGAYTSYDLFSNAPGLFRATGSKDISSHGWQRLDFSVTNATGRALGLRIFCFASPGSKVWCDDITVTLINGSTASVRGQSGALADVTGTPLNFTTGPDICSIDRVTVTPNFRRFTARNEQEPGYTASAFPQNDAAPIGPLAGTYDWTWGWASGADAIATVALTAPAGANPSTATVTAQGNGTTTIKSTATVTTDTLTNTAGRRVEGTGQVTVDYCTQPWRFDDIDNNCDAGGGCRGFNFSLYYCRDRSGTPLPDFSYAGSNGQIGSIEGLNTQDNTRLKSYFFKETPASRDAIGLLIYSNPDFLSPADWFNQRFPLDRGGSSATIAGYPAVRSGTTTYVGVTNLNSNQLEGLMFVFDYNSNNAGPDTQAIYGQLLDAAVFNTNPDLSADDKQTIRRDTQRRQDLAGLKVLFDQYKSKNGGYPTLDAGSYLPGLSTSKWPSWQATVGSLLAKTTPLDPVNTFSRNCAAPAEAATCWAESTKTFSCPADSHLYAYRSRNSGQAFDLYTTMEYTGTGGFAGAAPPSLTACDGLSPSTCSCFNFALHGG